MDPLGQDPLLRSFEHLYAKNRSARTVTTYLIAVRQADTFLCRRGTCLAAATRADLEAFLADPLARRPAPTTQPNPILSADSSPATANILVPGRT